MSSAPIFDYLLYALLAGYGVVVIRFFVPQQTPCTNQMAGVSNGELATVYAR